ncbi:MULTISPECIES: hypothetical protein [Streptomyces]|uniref:hypothetical protein n=1 Tax=Streptomyces TaxID=1883 RepID=UPI00131E130F|nr:MULTISPECIES: hypothetical protein [Streptomyces]MDI5912187.1 hypothetical protein [Streptomyces sp. 12257]
MAVQFVRHGFSGVRCGFRAAKLCSKGSRAASRPIPAPSNSSTTSGTSSSPQSHPTPLEFLTGQLPEPTSAWLLGCALRLAGVDDGARFWWQYAAGAEFTPAAYCRHVQPVLGALASVAGPEQVRVVDTPLATHLKYRVGK